MNEHTPNLADAKRDALRTRIEAAERRIAERSLVDDAREAAQTAADYARANPGKVVAGALVVGLVIGLMTAPGRAAAASAAARVTGKSKTSDAQKAVAEASEKSSKFVMMLANAVVTQALKIFDDVRDGAAVGAERAGDLAEKASDEAQRLGREAADHSGDFARRTRAAAETAARDIAKRVRG